MTIAFFNFPVTVVSTTSAGVTGPALTFGIFPWSGAKECTRICAYRHAAHAGAYVGHKIPVSPRSLDVPQYNSQRSQGPYDIDKRKEQCNVARGERQ